MAWLLRMSEYHVAPAALFHFSVNAGLYALKDAVTDVRLIALNGLVWMGAACVLTVVRREEFFQPLSADRVAPPTVPPTAPEPVKPDLPANRMSAGEGSSSGRTSRG